MLLNVWFQRSMNCMNGRDTDEHSGVSEEIWTHWKLAVPEDVPSVHEANNEVHARLTFLGDGQGMK